MGGERPRPRRISFRALGSNVSVEADEPQLRQQLEALVGTYSAVEQCEAAAVSFRLRSQPTAVELWRDGVVVRTADHELDLLPLFEKDLYDQLTRRAPAGWMLHAATVARDERAIVLVGESGAGKSTLALALVARGASYLTDDCSLILPDGTVQGIRRPICFDPGEQPATPVPAGFAMASSAVRINDEVVSALAVHPPVERLCERARLSHIVRIQHAPQVAGACRPLSCGEAICLLWPLSLRRRREDLDVANELLSRCEAVVDLTSSDSDVAGAVAAVEALWSA